MPYNRFTKGNQIHEGAFVGIVYDYVLGTTASACADRVGVSAKTVAKKFEKLSTRAAADKSIGGHLTDLPDGDDPVWSAMEFCIFECPSAELHYAVHEVPPNADKLHSRQSVTYKTKKEGTSCNICPLGNPPNFPERLTQRLFGMRTISQGWDSGKFKSHYVRSVLQCTVLTNRVENSLTPHDLVNVILKSLEKEPL